MSKTNDTERTRELNEAELDQIAGGTPSIPIPPPTPHRALTHAVSGFFRNGGTRS
jgi:hypothetical protein